MVFSVEVDSYDASAREDVHGYSSINGIGSMVSKYKLDQLNIPKIVGDVFKKSTPDFNEDSFFLHKAGVYYLNNYSRPSDWTIRKFNSKATLGINIPFVAPAIDEDHLLNDSSINSLDTLIHEPQHDLNQEGIGIPEWSIWVNHRDLRREKYLSLQPLKRLPGAIK